MKNTGGSATHPSTRATKMGKWPEKCHGITTGSQNHQGRCKKWNCFKRERSPWGFHSQYIWTVVTQSVKNEGKNTNSTQSFPAAQRLRPVWASGYLCVVFFFYLLTNLRQCNRKIDTTSTKKMKGLLGCRYTWCNGWASWGRRLRSLFGICYLV